MENVDKRYANLYRSLVFQYCKKITCAVANKMSNFLYLLKCKTLEMNCNFVDNCYLWDRSRTHVYIEFRIKNRQLLKSML